MQSSSKRLPRYVERTVSKRRAYYYVRIRGQRLAKLPGDPESPEFYEAYAAAMRAIEGNPARSSTCEGTVAWLVERYKRSPEYRTKSAKTQRSYDRELERLRPLSSFPAGAIKRVHIRELRDALADTPRTQQLFGQVCSLLFNFAARELNLEIQNPAAKLRRAGTAAAYLPWTPEQMREFEESQPPRHLMTAYMIARFSGPRRADIVGLRRGHYDGEALSIAGSKTSNPITVPVHPRLKHYLDSLQPTLTIIADNFGRPVSAHRLSHDMRKHLDKLGFCEISLHGLRHTAGAALAEAGCTPHEIAAVLGHASLQMVQRYSKKAEQKKMAEAAIVKLQRKG